MKMTTEKPKAEGDCSPRTCSVRVLVGLDEKGNWNSCGWSSGEEEVFRDLILDGLEGQYESFFWLTAELPVPVVADVAAEVSAQNA